MVAKRRLSARWAGYSPGMTPDEQLLLIFGGLHLVALLLGGVLFFMFLRADSQDAWPPSDDEDSGGGGGNDRISPHPKTSPSGGIPLPDAVQSGVRLRTGHDRLADPSRRQPSRRRVSEPARERPRVPLRSR
jgi:hypothetical protein